ncbi:MAG TPA: hypothetical protein VJN71_03310 [Nitrososphaerales archaeon]|nr:hypothetical protein [Nitrososphaerales archaeon]
MEKEGKAGLHIERFKKVILSWLSYNNLDVRKKNNIKGKSETSSLCICYLIVIFSFEKWTTYRPESNGQNGQCIDMRMIATLNSTDRSNER